MKNVNIIVLISLCSMSLLPGVSVGAVVGTAIPGVKEDTMMLPDSLMSEQPDAKPVEAKMSETPKNLVGHTVDAQLGSTPEVAKEVETKNLVCLITEHGVACVSKISMEKDALQLGLLRSQSPKAQK